MTESKYSVKFVFFLLKYHFIADILQIKISNLVITLIQKTKSNISETRIIHICYARNHYMNNLDYFKNTVKPSPLDLRTVCRKGHYSTISYLVETMLYTILVDNVYLY